MLAHQALILWMSEEGTEASGSLADLVDLCCGIQVDGVCGRSWEDRLQKIEVWEA